MTKVKTTLRSLLVLLMLLCLLTGCMGTVQDSGENEASLSPESVEEASREAEEAPDPDAPPEVRNFKMRYYAVSLSDIIRTRLCGRLICSDCLLFIDGRQPTGFI